MITSHINGYVQEASGLAVSHRERAVDCPGEESSRVQPRHCGAQMDRVQHYRDELRSREEEGKRDIDPNASLRLKKLSENPKVGIDNPTFEGKEIIPKDTSTEMTVGEFRKGGGRPHRKTKSCELNEQKQNNGN